MSWTMTSGCCPTCGSELPANAPQGLCPKCLIQGVAALTETGSPPDQRPAPPALDAVRAAFPHLDILELIGLGGMGAVFKARQPKLNRFVALKILPQSMACDPTFAERLAREGQLLARLTHPNVVTVHDFGSANGFFYLLMEYVDGVNLRQAMQAGRFTAEQALAIVPMICEALQYAHDEGVLHRDIKPENILLDAKGRVKLVDFGIAKLTDRHEPTPVAASVGEPTDIALTQSGSALGTPSYMAPEQRSSPSTVDQRADIYSLGVVFYEMLTGELPSGNPARPSGKTPIDPRVDAVVQRAMAHQREQRFRTAAEIRTCVEAITDPNASPAQPHPAIPTAAFGHPIPLTSPIERTLLILLVILLGLKVWELSPLLSLRNLWQVAQTGWMPAVVCLAGLTATGWLTSALWRHRRWLTAAILNPRPTATSSTSRLNQSEPWTLNNWLSFGWLALLTVLGLELILISISVTSTVAAVGEPIPIMLGSLVLPIGVFLTPPLLPVLLVILLVRRELRRPHTARPANPPPWMPRAAVLTLLFAIVTSPAVPDALGSTSSTGYGAMIAVTAIALLTRSRIWRAIALALMTGFAVISSLGFILYLLLTKRDQLPVEWSYSIGSLDAVVFIAGAQLLFLFCSVVGLVALLLPTTRAAFGLPPRRSQPTTPPPAQPIA